MMARGAVAAAAIAILLVVGVVAFRSHPSAKDVTVPTAFNLPALGGGSRVQLSDFRGKPVVVNLFASWCAECRNELPAFARAAARLRGRVQFIGVDSLETGDGAGMAAQYRLAASGFKLAKDVGPGGGGLHDALRAPGMPATVFYDATGRELFRDIASLPESTLVAQLNQFYGV